MATALQWVAGARPQTLPVVVAPVLLGTGAAVAADPAWGPTEAGRALLALVVGLALQVGVNYANDYSDGVRGTDDDRVGPARLTGGRAAAPAQVKAAALAALGVGCLAGLALALLAGQAWLIGVGAVCVLAAWFYTGGRRPYGYAGLGEVAVFVFFGLVATLGTTYTQLGSVTRAAALAAIGTGALACAVLVVNNLRDAPRDAAGGKHTLAVRLGAGPTRWLYAGLVGLAFLTALSAAQLTGWSLLVLLCAPTAVPPLRRVLGGATGFALVPVLGQTGRLNLLYGVLFTAGLVIGSF